MDIILDVIIKLNILFILMTCVAGFSVALLKVMDVCENFLKRYIENENLAGFISFVVIIELIALFLGLFNWFCSNI